MTTAMTYKPGDVVLNEFGLPIEITDVAEDYYIGKGGIEWVVNDDGVLKVYHPPASVANGNGANSAAATVNMLKAAHWYAAHGWHVIPLHEPLFDADGNCAGCTCEEWRRQNGTPDYVCPTPGKHPRIRDWEGRATTDETQIGKWWRAWPRANIGIAAGPSGLVVVDKDTYHAPENEGYLTIANTETVTSLTGGGGEHLIYRHPADGPQIRNDDKALPAWVNIRAHGGLFVAPPSLHMSGNRYEWEVGYGPHEMEPAELPPSLRELLQAADGRKRAAPIPERIADGGRNTTLTSLAGSMRRRGLDAAVIESALLTVNTEQCDPPLSPDEVKAIAKSVSRYAPSANGNGPTAGAGGPKFAVGQLVNVVVNGQLQNPSPCMIATVHPPANGTHGYDVAWADGTLYTYEEANIEAADLPGGANSAAATPGPVRLDDTGNSERFTAQHGDNVRYDHSTVHWYIWAMSHWRQDDDGGIQRLAKATARAIYEEAAAAAKVGRDEEAAHLSKWARTSAAESRRNAMLNLARAELPIAVTHDQFNRHDLLLNCLNGTLDLATWGLRPHDRADMLTYVLPVAYDPAAVCPLWDAFLARITGGDGALADFLARAVAYTLSGLTTEQCLFFLYGRGANGKSTFIETVMTLMGDLGHKARAQILMQDERGRVPNEIAALAGKRLVVASELADGGRLNEGLIKDLTGGDSMSARFLYGEPFTFKPTFKLWLYGNHKPTITGTDDGIWRRVRLIPFTVQIPEDERDAALPAKLKTELPGILAWAVRGWQRYQADGLQPPVAVATATAEYRADSDTLGQFFDDCCITAASACGSAGDLYAAYSEWATLNGLRPISNRRFGQSLGERGYEKARNNRGRWVYHGIGLLVARDIPEQSE